MSLYLKLKKITNDSPNVEALTSYTSLNPTIKCFRKSKMHPVCSHFIFAKHFNVTRNVLLFLKFLGSFKQATISFTLHNSVFLLDKLFVSISINSLLYCICTTSRELFLVIFRQNFIVQIPNCSDIITMSCTLRIRSNGSLQVHYSSTN